MARSVTTRAADKAEAKSIEDDLRGATAGDPAEQQPGRVARGYLYANHPETDVDVTFIPGELLPAWYGGATQ